jgi:hypothetical protein
LGVPLDFLEWVIRNLPRILRILFSLIIKIFHFLFFIFNLFIVNCVIPTYEFCANCIQKYYILRDIFNSRQRFKSIF